MSTAAANDLVSIVGDTAMFLCPGCDLERPEGQRSSAVHAIQAGDNGWTWNGSTTAPTFTPSVLVNRGHGNPTQPICHSFVTDGKIRYLGDCTHPLAGQTVDIAPWASRYDDAAQ